MGLEVGVKESFSRAQKKEKGNGNEGSLERGISGVRKIRGRHSQGDVQDHADVLDLGSSQILKDGNEIKQLIVVCVREPAADGYCVLRVEDVGGRGVVNDDCFLKVSSNLREILRDGQV